MTQRIGLAQAILASPSLVLLDEPTSALDPLGRRDVRDLIRSLRAEGITVFLNSHLLGEVEMVCDRVAIVDHGRVVRAGRLERPRLRRSPSCASRSSGSTRRCWPPWRATARSSRSRARRSSSSVGDLAVAPEVAAAVVGAGGRLRALVPAQRSLEDVFVGLVEGRTT